jgi:arabinose-5-phosphate isomerase
VLAFSWSGETPELATIVSHAKRFGISLVAVTSEDGSALARAADIVLLLPKKAEACPFGLAPTTSTMMEMALGDCLAMDLLEQKGFTLEDFKALHPGGKLGAKLKFVSDLMHVDGAMPLEPTTAPMSRAILTMTEKAMGCCGVCDEDARLTGIITDGDLRRHIDDDSLMTRRVEEVMTTNPKTISPDTTAAVALEMMNAAEITALFVVENDKPVGIVHIHDLLRAGVA